MSDLNVYTTAEINALSSPVTGDLVVDSDLNAIKLYNGSAWKTFTTDGAPAAYLNRWAAYFDGSDHITTNYTPAASSGATISIWFKASSFSKTTGLVTSGDTTSASLGNFNILLLKGSNCYYIQVGNGTSNSLHHCGSGFGSSNDLTTTSAPGYLFDNLWHHIVATIDGTAIKLYLDGGNQTVNANRSNTQGSPYITATSAISYTGNVGDIHIGKGHPTFHPDMTPAYVDEFAYFEYALTGSEVSALYNNGVPGNSGSYNPGIWIRMGDDSNDSPTDGIATASITDSSGNGNTISQSTASKQPAWSDLTGETIYS